MLKKVLLALFVPIFSVVLLVLIAVALIEGPALDPFLYAVF